jgi:hypothetical protein
VSDRGDIPAAPSEEPDPGDEPDPGERERPRLTSSWAVDLIGKRAQYSGIFAQQYPSLMKNLFAGLPLLNTTNWLPPIKATNLLLPQIKLPTSILDSVLKQFGKNVSNLLISPAVFGSATKIFELQREQWESLFSGLRSLADTFFPPNWKGVDTPDIEAIEAILLDEGIPLAWVPNPAILQALFDAPDEAARRRIIGRRWRGIVSDCEGILNEVMDQDLLRHQSFAMDVVQALRDGHVSAAQALAANLLDSILRCNFEKNSFKRVTTNKKGGDRFDIDDYRGRTAFTLAPIWRAYAEYWENQGDPIPRVFGRHPSAHAVSRTQYSRVNAVIGLMLVTSLLRLLDSEAARG